jgi:protein-S-isoprenylcysteine O-methyltransferase Ste14
MYVGATAVLVGTGLAFSSPSILVLALAFLALMHLFVVLHEERTLARTFGSSYLEYKAAVHRWLPRIPGRSASRGAG